jgi:DNA ligase-1
MELERLVLVVEQVRGTRSRTEKLSFLSGLLRAARGEDAALAALYLSGKVPQGRVGVGWRTLRGLATEAPPEGDRLSLRDVKTVLDRVAGLSGPGANAARTQALRALFARAHDGERRFLASLLLGELRQGAEEGLVQEAVAMAAGVPPADLRQAAMLGGDLGAVARAALEEGARGLERFSLHPLVPVSPMLASSAASVPEALERLGRAAFEYKVDGARVQLHRAGDTVRVFTRQLQDVTSRVPELVELARELPTTEAVLEGEAIALREDGRPRPFQETMRRFSRSRDVEGARRATPLTPYFFDCLYVEGEGPLLGRPYADRAAWLARLVPGALLPRLVTDDASEAQRFFEAALAAGHEGLMAKSLSAPYVAGQRGFHWLKLKAAKTLDLVVLAAEWGSGRRRGWLSNLHLGARDAGGFVMLGKTFKGLTDKMLRWQTERLLSLEERRDEWTVFVRPELVVEVAFSDVQESPRYPARLALRFARVKRHRPDKPAAEADTLETVAGIFRRQRA